MIVNDVIVRAAEAKDLDFVLKANAEINAKSSQVQSDIKSRLKEDLFGKKPKAWGVIAEVDGEPVGMALYSTSYFANEGEIMWVSQMYVEPSFRNRKQWIAPAVMSGLINTAQEKGWDYICWATATDNNIPKKLSQKIGAKALDNFVMYALPIKE